MKKEIKKDEHDEETGIYARIETIEIAPEDGFVHQADIHQVDPNNYGKYHKGYSKNISITTNNPKITRKVVLLMATIFAIIGFVLLLIGILTDNLVFIIGGIIWLIIPVWLIIDNEKHIKEREKNNK